jgi:hypothetical protein
MSDWFFRGDYGVAPTNYAIMVMGLLLAFVCGHAIAWAYMVTHTGLSYSRSYVSTLVFMPVIVTMVMMILANNLVLAFGLMAIFAMVRFRSILRDTLDTACVLAVIVIGLACGTLKFTSAIVGCLAAVGLILYFWLTAFGTRHRYNLILNIQWARTPAELEELRSLLRRHSREFQCASQSFYEGDHSIDLSYRLRLRDPARSQELMDALKGMKGVAGVSSLHAGDESEL